jgi:hypothetical protein
MKRSRRANGHPFFEIAGHAKPKPATDAGMIEPGNL